jgi:restriction system protein
MISLGIGLGLGMISGAPRPVAERLAQSAEKVTLVLTGLLIPERQVPHGLLIRSTSALWVEVVRVLGGDWGRAMEIPSDKWEEIVAGGFKQAGYHEVTLTPRSRDFGRDVIATKRGMGTVTILGSVKAYKPDHLVTYDDIRALYGVVMADGEASKGMLATTSDFPPLVGQDPLLAPLIPSKLELINGEGLRQMLLDLANGRECEKVPPEGDAT